MHNLYLLLLAIAVATPSTMDVPTAPSPFQSAPSSSPSFLTGRRGSRAKEKDKDKDKKDRPERPSRSGRKKS